MGRTSTLSGGVAAIEFGAGGLAMTGKREKNVPVRAKKNGTGTGTHGHVLARFHAMYVAVGTFWHVLARFGI